MHPRRNAVAPEEQHAEETGLEEESGEGLVRDQRPRDVGGRVGKPAPVGAELKRHDDARHHAHAERDREYLEPESGEAEIDRAPGRKVKTLQHRDVPGETDGERRKENVHRDHPEELKSRQQYRVERHHPSRAEVSSRLYHRCRRLLRATRWMQSSGSPAGADSRAVTAVAIRKWQGI